MISAGSQSRTELRTGRSISNCRQRCECDPRDSSDLDRPARPGQSGLVDQRPKLWMHRTFRFWGGLSLLILLFAMWLGTMSTESSIRYSRPSSYEISAVKMSFESGGFQGTVERWFWDTPSPRWGTGWNLSQRTRHHVRMLPRLTRSTIEGPHQTVKFYSAFLPLWIPLLAWAILWPMWMRRGDREKSLAFSEDQAPADPG